MAEQLTDEMLAGRADAGTDDASTDPGAGAPETPHVRRLDGPATEPVDLAGSRAPTLAACLAIAAALVAVVAVLVRRRP